jgi:hypothetical protein
MDKNLFFDTTPLHESFLIKRPDVCAIFAAQTIKGGNLWLLPLMLYDSYTNRTLERFGIKHMTTRGQIRMHWFSLTGEFIGNIDFDIPEGYVLRKGISDNEIQKMNGDIRRINDFLSKCDPIALS